MTTSSRRASGPVLCSLSPSDIFYSHAPPCSTTRRMLPTRITVASLASSVRLIPSRSFSARTGQSSKRPCSCSPTSHPGSFRCGLHKGSDTTGAHAPSVRKSAVTKSVVKRALAVLTRPSSHSQSRRANFKSQPSGLSVMSKANL
ncbi:hypothetical protein AALP_AA7G085900 [Arabis alpina]|uniref:Serine-rich protein-like protein n=1 Tax=Arabis alpina TaxID=50452 RepID=A0A087GGS5_ARAAL|nr:hypothetical protein AALP_AA7G085900 [Arabis alpina]